MNAKDFDEIVTARMDWCMKTLCAKGDEYARDGDRLWNFKVASRKLNCHPAEALAGMMVGGQAVNGASGHQVDQHFATAGLRIENPQGARRGALVGRNAAALDLPRRAFHDRPRAILTVAQRADGVSRPRSSPGRSMPSGAPKPNPRR